MASQKHGLDRKSFPGIGDETEKALHASTTPLPPPHACSITPAPAPAAEALSQGASRTRLQEEVIPASERDGYNPVTPSESAQPPSSPFRQRMSQGLVSTLPL